MSLVSRKQLLSQLLLGALFLSIFVACSSTPTSPTTSSTTPASEMSIAPASRDDDILHIHQATYDILDPQKSFSSNEIAILQLNYEGLSKLNSDLQVIPAAAEEWKFNEEGDIITFTLRSNLKYSDGSPLTSENFRYSIERTCDPKTAGGYQSILFEIIGCQVFASTAVSDVVAYEAAKQALNKSVETPDEQTLVLHLNNPAPYYPYIAGMPVMYPVKQELVNRDEDAWWKSASNQIGNGPFKITKIVEDQIIRVEVNKNYWDTNPKLDGIEISLQNESSIALAAYKAGQLDIITLDPSQITATKADATLSKELLTYPGASTSAWSFNLTKEPFNDKKVREAFAYALDRETFCTIIRSGTCVPAYSWIPEDVPGAIKTDTYTFDPVKAKQSLAESSYGGPDRLPEIKLAYYADDPAVQPRIEWVATQLREHLNINVSLDPWEEKALNAVRQSPETHPQVCVFCTIWFQDYPDPQNWLSVYWTCNAIYAKAIGYCNRDFDNLTKQGDAELDTVKRIRFYERASEILLDDAVAPPVFHPAQIFLVKPAVTGYTTTSADAAFPGQWSSILTITFEQ